MNITDIKLGNIYKVLPLNKNLKIIGLNLINNDVIVEYNDIYYNFDSKCIQQTYNSAL